MWGVDLPTKSPEHLHHRLDCAMKFPCAMIFACAMKFPSAMKFDCAMTFDDYDAAVDRRPSLFSDSSIRTLFLGFADLRLYKNALDAF